MFNRGLIKELNLTIKTLTQTINELEDELKKEKEKNETYQHGMVIILENNAEARRKIEDLENNIEFLFNNLSKAKKELVRPSNQN